MKLPNKVFFVSDKKEYTDLYRSALFSEFSANMECKSVGFFDSYKNFFSLICFFSVWKTFVLVSNIKSNLIILFLLQTRGLIIFNGLGRYRSSKIFRILLLVLLKIRRTHFSFAFQNYKDFRYFRRYFSDSVFWVLGSGGRSYQISSNVQKPITIITRANKLILQIQGLREFILDTPIQSKIQIFGRGKISEVLYQNELDQYAYSRGWRDIDKIFKDSSELCCLPGYGEGVPHSLVDAICSGLSVWISASDYRDFGFYKINGIEAEIHGNWRYLRFSELARSYFHCDKINDEYMRAFKLFIADRV